MSAPDLATVYQIEKHVEEGLATVLAAETGLACFTTFSASELTTPRLEIVSELGAMTGQYGNPTIDGEPRCVMNTWEIQFTVRYVTDVIERGASAAQHSIVRGQVRAAMAVWRGLFTADAFPYHTLGRPLDVSTAVDVNNDEDFDTSEMVFSSPVNIRDDAWPSSI